MGRNLIVYAAGLAFCGAPVWAQQQQQPSQQQPRQSQQQQGQQGQQGERGQQQQQAPEGFVYIREDVVYLMANEPQPHLTAALARIAAGDKRAAAQEMKIAAAFLDLQASRGQQGAEDQKLTDASRELKQLADQFAGKRQQAGEQGQQQQQQQANQGQVMELHRTFAKVNAALASHFNSLAKSELQDKKYIAAGYDLNAAATSLAQAYVWTRQRPQGQTLDNAGVVASNLVGEDIGAALRQARAQAGGNAGGNANANAGAAATDSARTAGARLNPITGTTPAEAKNITEHARQISDALDKDIQQFERQLEQGGQGRGQGQQHQQQQHQQGDRSQQGQGSAGSGQTGSSSSSSSSSGSSGSSSPSSGK